MDEHGNNLYYFYMRPLPSSPSRLALGIHTHAGLFQVLFLFGGHVRATHGEHLCELEGPVALTIHPSLAHGFASSRSCRT
jgi:hypothetical protein